MGSICSEKKIRVSTYMDMWDLAPPTCSTTKELDIVDLSPSFFIEQMGLAPSPITFDGPVRGTDA